MVLAIHGVARARPLRRGNVVGRNDGSGVQGSPGAVFRAGNEDWGKEDERDW